METQLYSYSIMRLNVPDDKILSVCEDIKQQYLQGVSSCPLFSMTLVPEGKTPMDKVYKTCAKYKKFKDILDEMGIPTGVLIQASLGHGYVLGDKFTFQGYVGFEDGIEQQVACPADKDFQQYIYDMIKEVAKLNPKTIMMDDDLRLIARPGKGCACPLHMKMINDYALFIGFVNSDLDCVGSLNETLCDYFEQFFHYRHLNYLMMFCFLRISRTVSVGCAPF